MENKITERPLSTTRLINLKNKAQENVIEATKLQIIDIYDEILSNERK
jgi:hypothetical protein